MASTLSQAGGDKFGDLPVTEGRSLLVFARAPVAGRCKTRLIPRYGARGAAAIHRQLVLRALATAAQAGVDVTLCCEPDCRHGFFRQCRQRFAVRLQAQARGDLGRKMALALQRGLRNAASVVIIGTDCPALRMQDLESAFTALEHGADYVLQPASDGGYVLIGARRGVTGALRHIDWSSGRELRQTLARLRQLNLRAHLLTPSWDVDYPKDVRHARRLRLLK